MSSTLTKNIVLSQQKAGSNGDVVTPPTLNHDVSRGEKETVLSVEIPGVDPSTVNVSCEGSILKVECPRGVLTHAVDLTTNVSNISADIQWGLLTLKIPNPPAPKTHAIKVSVHDAVKSAPASKAKGKDEEFTDKE